MNKKNKKGFTLTELIVVIVIIAILAAVLIPTYTGIVKKARISADTQLAKNMNDALTLATVDGTPCDDIADVLTIVHDAGYVIESLNPTTAGYYFAWDIKSNQILFLDNNFDVYYSANKNYSAEKINWWTTVGTADEAGTIASKGTSIYLEKDIASLALTNLVSIDTGFNKLGTLTMTSNATGTTILRGQFGTVTIDAANATIDQYGSIDSLTITAINTSCFNVHGYVADVVNVAAGLLVNKGVINTITAAAANTVKNEAYIGTATDITLATGSIAAGAFDPENLAIIEVANATELQNLAYAVNAGADFSAITIKLTADIDFNGRTWTPFGVGKKTAGSEVITNSFSGTIDGNNHSIIGLSNSGYVGNTAFSAYTTSYGTTGYAYGLIGYGANDVTVKNLTLDVTLEDSNAFIGGVMGAYNSKEMNTMYSSLTDKTFTVNIEKVTVKGTISGNDNCGGILGTTYVNGDPSKNYKLNINLTNCTNNASVSGQSGATKGRVGGIIGKIAGFAGYHVTTLTNCTNNGAITSYDTTHYAGGIVGCAFPGSANSVTTPVLVYSGCTNNGTLTNRGTTATKGMLLGYYQDGGAYFKVDGTAIHVTTHGYVNSSTDYGAR